MLRLPQPEPKRPTLDPLLPSFLALVRAGQHALRREGKHRWTCAQRVFDGAGDRCGRRTNGRLADPPGAEGPEPLSGLEHDAFDGGNIRGGGDEVLEETTGQVHAVLNDHFLEEGRADTHGHSAADLTLHASGVDRATHVV